MTLKVEPKENIELIWGSDQIGEVIGRSARQVNHLLSIGALPAKKVGGTWVAERGRLIAYLMGDAA